MSFGFKAINDGSSIQIDDSYPVLQYTESGSAPANVNVYFSRTYTTVMPPWLFLRGGNGGYLMGLKFIGSPGAWTGFKLHACSDIEHNHGLSGRNYGTYQFIVGEWTVKKSTEDFGLRLWNEDGALTFDSGARMIHLRYQFKTWAYSSRSSDGGWLFYRHILTLDAKSSLANANNYLLINPLMRERFNVPGGDGTSFRKVGPLTGGQIIHVTRSGYTNYSVPYIHPGIIGSPSY